METSLSRHEGDFQDVLQEGNKRCCVTGECSFVATRLKRKESEADTLIARRTSKFDVASAWQALLEARDPKEILTNKRLLAARAEINEEVERHTHTPPKFSKDGKIAVLRIHSAAQVHPVIATRWVWTP